MTMYDVSCLRYLFLAGEPLDEPTSRWITDALKIPVIDHYWQTETGWPMLSYLPGVDLKPNRFGSPGSRIYGYNIRVISEGTGEEVPRGEKGVLVVEPPLPPGCLSTVWGDDERFVKSYFSSLQGDAVHLLDWAVRDEDGYYFIMGRTDDVINVAGHRLGTREIEEAIQNHPAIAEVAVVGVADKVKGQVPVGFCRLEGPEPIEHRRRNRETGEGSYRQGAGVVGRGGQTPSSPFRHRAAENPLRQVVAPLDSGTGRRP
jgi:propionyl-CoA synthetase